MTQALLLAALLLGGCTGVIMTVENPAFACTTSRSVEVVKVEGEPTTNKVTAQRDCAPPPAP